MPSKLAKREKLQVHKGRAALLLFRFLLCSPQQGQKGEGVIKE